MAPICRIFAQYAVYGPIWAQYAECGPNMQYMGLICGIWAYYPVYGPNMHYSSLGLI